MKKIERYFRLDTLINARHIYRWSQYYYHVFLTSTNAFYIASPHMNEAIYQTANISSPAKTFRRLGCA